MRPIPPDEIRPVLATEPKWSDTGVDLELEQRIVKIDEDGGRLRAVLDACDGLRTVSELGDEFGADARDLVRQLLATGGLVDVDQLWRRFHRLSGNPPPISRQISEDEVDELMRETFAPAEPIGDAIALAPLDSHVGAAARRRRSSSPEEQTNALGWEQLGALLSVAYGRAGDRWFTVPSGGALYPLVAHVLVRKPIGPLDPGVWWYDHWRGELRPQQLGRPDVEPMLIPHPVTDRLIAREEPIIAISADLRRTCRKYGARGYRFALMETGAVMQTAYLVGAELDIPVRACGGYYDGSVNALLGHPEGVVCTLMLFARRMTPTLVAPWLLAAGPAGLLAVGPRQVVEVELRGSRAGLVALVAALATGAPVRSVGDQVELEAKEIDELHVAALEDAGALDGGGDGSDQGHLRRPEDAAPLKDVLAATLGGASPTSCYTAEELLLIPADCPGPVARRALHAFVGGARPEARAVAYGQVAAYGDGLLGDRPTVDVAAAAHGLDPSLLHVVTLDEGTSVSIAVDELQHLGAERAHRLGVVQQVLSSGAVELGGPIYIARARHATANLRFGSDAWSYGVAAEPGDAELIARAEAAERHAPGRTHGVTLRRAHSGELDGVVDSDSLAAPNERQRAALPAPTTDERLWVAARTSDGDQRWVPAEAALFPFTDPVRPEPWLVASSSGVAAHMTTEEATERALRELIERDAMMWRWVQRVPPAHIAEGSLPEAARRRLAAVRQQGWQVDLLDLTLDLLPVAMCAMRRTGQLSLGLGCSRSASTAALRALEECVMIALSSEAGPDPIGDPTAVRTPTDHLALHHDPVHAAGHQFLFESADEIDPRDVAAPEESLPQVVRHVGETVVIDYAVPQVRPFLVVRALVPGLVPISFGYDREPLGLPRLGDPITTRDGRTIGHHLDLSATGPILPHPFP